MPPGGKQVAVICIVGNANVQLRPHAAKLVLDWEIRMSRVRRAAAPAPKTKPGADAAGTPLPLQVLMKFRLIINTAKQHFKWVEERCGINGTQLWVLCELRRSPRMGVSELAAAMAMHQSTVSILVNKLVTAKLVKRVRSTVDQRAVTLSITESGSRLLAKAPQPARGMLYESLHRLPEHTLLSLDGLLGQVLGRMKPVDEQSMKRPLPHILDDK
jgi:DNA-binding MarR family transcriptional regulator